MKTCIVCGVLTEGSRCPQHRSEQEHARNRRRAPFRRDRYGKKHRKDRAMWEPLVATGKVTCRRGEGCRHVTSRILPGEAWHLGHPDEECPAPTGPEHEDCNTSAAGRQSHA